MRSPRFRRAVALITRRIRFPGRQILLRTMFPPEGFRTVGEDEEMITDYDGGLSFYCDLGSWIEWNVFFKGYYSPDMSLVIQRLVKSGMVALDVGANVGSYTLLMANRAGRKGKVIAFEPYPEVSARLRKNLAANSFGMTVRVIEVALGDRTGNATFYTPKADHFHRGISSLNAYADVLTESHEVRLDTLDSILPSLELPGVDFIKIDTEGLDPAVIHGGESLITKYRPIVIFESNYTAIEKPEESIRTVQKFLSELDYRFHTVATFGRLSAVDNSKLLPDADVVCLPAI